MQPRFTAAGVRIFPLQSSVGETPHRLDESTDHREKDKTEKAEIKAYRDAELGFLNARVVQLETDMAEKTDYAGILTAR